MTCSEWKAAFIAHMKSKDATNDQWDEVAESALHQSENEGFSDSLEETVQAIAIANGADASRFGDSNEPGATP